MAATTKNGSTNRIKDIVDEQGPTIVIPRPNIRTIQVPIVGITPLISCAWSHKARQMMLDKQMKKAKGAKEAKDPEADVQASIYRSVDGWCGFPAVAFKAAMVGACRAVDGLPMTIAKRMAFVQGEGKNEKGDMLIRLHGSEPEMFENMVRLETGVADIRFRALYREWSATLVVEFNAGVISAEQVVNLIDLAGYSEGVGDWRPSAPKNNTGTYGRWTVKRG